MKAQNLFVAITLLAMIGLVGCGKEEKTANLGLQEGTSMSEAGTQVVKAANGSLYAVSCLRENAAAITQAGQGASSSLERCKMDPASGQGRNFHRSGSYYYVYWPPTYYNPSTTYSYYYPQSTTNYYPGYTQSFCGYVFGGNAYANNNCYQLFGYNTNYTSYYNQSCGTCLNSYYGQCQNRCWNGYAWAY